MIASVALVHDLTLVTHNTCDFRHVPDLRLEDWLAANDPEFFGEVRRIRNEEDLAEAGKDIGEVLKRWPIE